MNSLFLPTCAKCNKTVDSVQTVGSFNGEVLEFNSRCHGNTSSMAVTEQFLKDFQAATGRTLPYAAFTREGRPCSSEEAFKIRDLAESRPDFHRSYYDSLVANKGAYYWHWHGDFSPEGKETLPKCLKCNREVIECTHKRVPIGAGDLSGFIFMIKSSCHGRTSTVFVEDGFLERYYARSGRKLPRIAFLENGSVANKAQAFAPEPPAFSPSRYHFSPYPSQEDWTGQFFYQVGEAPAPTRESELEEALKFASFQVHQHSDLAALPAKTVGAGALGTSRTLEKRQDWPSLQQAWKQVFGRAVVQRFQRDLLGSLLGRPNPLVPDNETGYLVGETVYCGPEGLSGAERRAARYGFSIEPVDLRQPLPKHCRTMIAVGQDYTQEVIVARQPESIGGYYNVPEDRLDRPDPKRVVQDPEARKDYSKHPLWDLPQRTGEPMLMVIDDPIGEKLEGAADPASGGYVLADGTPYDPFAQASVVQAQELDTYVTDTGCEDHHRLLVCLSLIWGADSAAKRKWLDERCDPLGGKPVDLLRKGHVGKVIGFLEQAA